MLRMILVSTAAVVMMISTVAASTQLAFPGAEGYGRFATGGRGGDVCTVTSLDDAGPGTLRECVQTASGPQTVVFGTSGTISLDSEIDVWSNITIAGQTAPGDGIQIKHGNNLMSPFYLRGNDIIMQHLKIRPGPTAQPASTPNCIQVAGKSEITEDIMLAHLSCSWATDQLIATNDVMRVTIQHSLFYEGLNRSTHPGNAHSKGPNLRGCGVSLVKNLIANSEIRNPNNTCGKPAPGIVRGGGVLGENAHWNNVIFNGKDGFLDYWNGRGESWLNLIGNVVIAGPSTKGKLNSNAPHGVFPVDAWDISGRWNQSGVSDPQHLCLQDNISVGFPSPIYGGDDPVYGVLNPNDSHLVESTDCINAPVFDPDAIPGVEGRFGVVGNVLPSADVEAEIAAHAGALWWNRDEQDQRIIRELGLRQGALIDHPEEVGGWPVIAVLKGPADSDGDGMPDAWEIDHGLDPNDPEDRNGDLSQDGWTNLEGYLHDAGRYVDYQIPPIPVNAPPMVDAGPDLTVTLPNVALLSGTVDDDGLPNPPGETSVVWTLVSGPGTVTMGNPYEPETEASFPEAGTYVLRLTASDGDLGTADEVQVTVEPVPGQTALEQAVDVANQLSGQVAESQAQMDGIEASVERLNMLLDEANQ